MNFYNFRRGAQGVTPYFKGKEENVSKITGNLVGVYFNEPKEISYEGKNITIPANIAIKLDNDTLQVSIDAGSQFRATVNSLLSANIGDNIELSTYIAKSVEGKEFKVIGVSNPDKKRMVTSNRTGKEVEINEGYAWVYSKSDIPEIEVIKNKKGEFVSIDDNEANEFFIDKLKEKFSLGGATVGLVSANINIEDIF